MIQTPIFTSQGPPKPFLFLRRQGLQLECVDSTFPLKFVLQQRVDDPVSGELWLRLEHGGGDKKSYTNVSTPLCSRVGERFTESVSPY